jgi:hypothetical protein
MVGLGGLEPPTSPLSEQHDLVLQQLRRPRGLPKYAEVVQGIVCCGLDCGLEKVHEFCGNPHFHFLEIRSSISRRAEARDIYKDI